MTTIYFADGSTKECETTSFKDVYNSVGEDIIENITNEIEYYDLDDDEKALVNEHPNADFYMAFDDVFGAWKQPLYIFAVD